MISHEVNGSPTGDKTQPDDTHSSSWSMFDPLSLLKEGAHQAVLVGEGFATALALNPYNGATRIIDGLTGAHHNMVEFSNQKEVDDSAAGQVGYATGMVGGMTAGVFGGVAAGALAASVVGSEAMLTPVIITGIAYDSALITGFVNRPRKGDTVAKK